MLNRDKVREATRLTRAGRLAEATALLKRMLRGESASDVTFPTHRIALPGGDPLAIDAKKSTTDETKSVKLAQTKIAQPRLLRALRDNNKEYVLPGMRGLTKRAPPSTADCVPEGAKFIEGTYSNSAGSRAYRLFVPTQYHGQPLPLIILLHGCTQSPEDFAAGTRMNFVADEQPCFVAYPAQRTEANQAKCWNWFRTVDQQRGEGEPSIIAGITRQIIREYSVDPKRVYVAGLSAGAAAAAIMGATYSDVYAAVGIHSGLACGAAADLPSALLAMRQGGTRADRAFLSDRTAVPTIIFHGDRDNTVHPINGDQVLEQSAGATSMRKKVYRGRVPGGHAYTRTTHVDANGREMFEHWSIHGAGH